jgi:hypothetical protein
MTTQLAPTPVFKAFDNNGNPLANGQLLSLVAGTSTPQATWVDFTQTTQNTNPVILNARGECNLWLDPTLTYKLVLKDSLGNQIWSVDNISGALNPNASIIPAVNNLYTLGNAQFSWANLYLGPGDATVLDPVTGNIGYYARTAAEIATSVTPVNFVYPPMMVDRYATNTAPGTTDMTAAWQAAIAVASVNGGVVTCLGNTYLVSSTLTINGPACIDGGSTVAVTASFTAGSNPGCAVIYAPTLNAPILSYGVGSRFVRLDNITIIGGVTLASGTTGITSQVGVQIGTGVGAGAHGIRMKNVAVQNCGQYGINVINSVSGDYQDIYVVGGPQQSNAGSTGIVINAAGGGSVGANRWYNISVTTCASAGIDVNATGGGIDVWYGVTAEVCAFGIVFESGVVGQRMYGIHTERNVTQSIWFKSGSNQNEVDCETVGSSEQLPLNQGGAQNTWSGNWVVSSVLKDPVQAKCIQRVSTIATAKVFNAANTAYSTGVAPTNSGGLQVLSQSIVQRNTGTRLVVRAWGISSIHTTGIMIVALFGPGSSTAVQALSMPAVGDSVYSWSMEYEVAAGTQNNASTFTVNVGSTSASDGVTFGGGNNVLYFGGIGIGGISIEEYFPSTG